MNKKEIISILKKYNFDKNEYVVISGAAMVLYNLKETTSDIDLSVSEDYLKFLLENYECTFDKLNEYGKEVYYIDDIINVGVSYMPNKKEFIDDIPVSSVDDIIKLKKHLNRDNDKIDLERISNNISSLALAYLGDCVYELYIRKYLLSKGIVKVNDLQKEAIKYVSAKNQSNFLEKMISTNFLTDEEMIIVKRARNHKSHSSKSVDIVTYKRSTGLEALIGYLEIANNKQRIDEIMNFIVGD